MPATKPTKTAIPGEALQFIKVDSPPAAPYVLQSVFAVPAGTVEVGEYFGVRPAGQAPTSWLLTRTQLIARTKTHDYYWIGCRVTSGTATLFYVDLLDGRTEPVVSLGVDGYGVKRPKNLNKTYINADAWDLLRAPNALQLQLINYIGGSPQQLIPATLTGGFGASLPLDQDPVPPRQWSSRQLHYGSDLWGPFVRRLYKHIAVSPGGQYGYMHIWATVMADAPEIQFVVNWHNGAIEERQGPPTGGASGGNIPPEDIGSLVHGSTDADTIFQRFGLSRAHDVIFSRLLVKGFSTIADAADFPGAVWTMTPALQEAGGAPSDSCIGIASTAGGARPDNHSLVTLIENADLNRRHPLLVCDERSFRFAVHPVGWTPYQKLVTGRSDWARFGGWGGSPIGIPNLTDVGSAVAGLDLEAEAATIKTALRNLSPYAIEDTTGGQGQGMTPPGKFNPSSWVPYGGATSGLGMWPDYGTKSAWSLKKGSLDILKVEQLRARARTPGCLYYNMSGAPVEVRRHVTGSVAGWDRFNRTFQKNNGQVQDSPFVISALHVPVEQRAQVIALADYNPGPRQGSQGFREVPPGSGIFLSVDSAGDATPNVPDWWVTQTDGNTIGVGRLWLSGNGLAHTVAPDLQPGWVDRAVPVILQMQDLGAGNTFNNTKSITFRIVGTGDFDIATTEDVTLTGPSSSIPAIQAVETVSKFKTVSSIECTAITGTLLSTEKFSLGRAPVGIADYNGSDGISPLDGQHAIRYHTANKALFFLEYDPLAKLYLWMDGADVRMTYWEGPIAGGRSGSRITPDEWGAAGRGSISSRELAWAADIAATAIAIQHGHFSFAGDLAARNIVYADQFLGWQTWLDTMARRFLNARMTNGLFLNSNQPKEMKQTPFGTVNGGEGVQLFFGMAGRELGYFEHGLFMLANAYSPLSPVTAQELANLELALRDSAVGWRDFIWRVVDAGTITQPHVYLPTAMLNGGAVAAGNVFGNYNSYAWTFFATQAQIPAVNPMTGLLINPANYPTVDDDWYAGAVTGTSVQMNSGSGAANGTAITVAAGTLLKTATDVLPDGSGAWVSGPGGACPVRLKILGGGTYTSAKRRTFRVTGTDPKTGAVITDDILAQGNGAATQEFQTLKHFATVTSIQMRTDGAVGNTGSTVVGETFRFGTTKVGLKAQQEQNVPGAQSFPTYGDGLQVAYALAVMKFLGDRDGTSSAVDTCIKRHCAAGLGATPAASLAAALTEILSNWLEYAGGPAQRCEQWLKLLWCLTYNDPAKAPVADFVANVTSGAAPLTVSFLNKTYGKLNANDAATKPHQWDFGDGSDISNVRHPTHIYTVAGDYTVSYIATGPGGTDTETKTAHIHVTP